MGHTRTLRLAFALLAVAPAAFAQASQSAVVAEQLFREGEQLFTAGRTHEACEKFAASNKLDPAPGTLNNLAVCHEKEGRTASAWFEFTELAALAERAGKKDRQKAARDRAAALEKNLARVQVVAPADARLTSIEIDGAALDAAAAGTAFPIDPGEHTFRFGDDKGRRATAKLVVPPGPSTTPITPALVDSPPAPAPAREPGAARPPDGPAPSDRGGPRPAEARGATRTVGFVLLGVGALGVGVGSVFGLMASAHRNDKPNDTAFTDAEIATVAFGVGLVAAAAGAILVIAAPKGTTSAWYVAPSVAPGGGQLKLGGSF